MVITAAAASLVEASRRARSEPVLSIVD